MSLHKCAICGRNNDIFALDFGPDETDALEKWTSYICGTCWEHVAAIARRTLATRLDEIEAKLAALEAKQ